MRAEVRVFVYLCCLDFFREKFREVVLLLKQAHDLLKRRKNQHFVLQELSYRVNRRFRVVTGRDEDTSNFGPRHETYKMLCNLWLSHRIAIPLHFYEVQNTAEFNNPINLLDNPFTSLTNQVEGFIYE